MRNKHHSNGLSMLLLIVLLCILQTGFTAYAESLPYKSLEVELPYKHIYTTTDVSADSEFHYCIFPKDDAPLPYEAEGSGAFSVRGVSGSGVKEKDKTVFDIDGKLTFKFAVPGIYSYDIKADSEADGKKQNSSRYTLNPDTITVTFYVTGESEDNQITLKMMTAESNEEKLSEIVLEAKYSAPEKTTTSSESSVPSSPSSSTISRPNSTSSNFSSGSASQSDFRQILKTGDDRNTFFYVLVMILSASIISVILVLTLRQEKVGGDYEK